MTSTRFSWIVFVLALIVRLAYLGLVYDGPDSLRQPDSPAFELPAQELIEYGIIALPPSEGTAAHKPFTERVPGYILFLAAIKLIAGPAPLAVVLAQILIDSATCVMIARLAHQIAPRLARPAGLMAAAAPNMVISAAQILSDSAFLLPFTLFLTASVQAVEQRSVRRAAVAGLWLGVATMIRPTPWILIGIMPLLLTLLTHGWRRRVTLGCAMFAVALAVVMPWLARNATAAGHWQFSSQTGTHALYWVVPLTREYGAGISPEETKTLMRERLTARIAATGPDARLDNPFELSAMMSAVAKDALLESGVGVMARAWVIGAAINLLSPAVVAAPPVQYMPRPSFYDTAGSSIIAKLVNYFSSASANYLSIMAVGLLGTGLVRALQLAGIAAVLRGAWPPKAAVILAVVCVYMIAITGPITGVKYRMPLEPVLILLLAEGLLRLSGKLRR